MIKKLFGKKFVKDNLILFIGTLIVNIFGFLFHFYMGRSLGPEHYGALGAALSILYIMNIPLNTIQTGIAKFTSLYNMKKEYGKIKYIFKKSFKVLLLVGFIGLVIFNLAVPFIADFLGMEASTLIVLSSFLIVGLIVPINRGILQGMQDFKGLSINLIGEGLVKFLVGVLLVVLGYGVNGAVGAIIASYVFVIVASLIPLRKVLAETPVKADSKEVYEYTKPVLIMVSSLTLLYSLDIILVKHFFNNIDAGYYSATSLIGKIIFFGSISISQVMFPKTSELYQQGEKHKHILYKSLLVMVLIVIPGIIFYFLFPGFIVNLFYGGAYMPVAPLIGFFGIFIGLICFIYLISFYNISVNRKGFLWVLMAFNVIEVIGLWIFHDSLIEVIKFLIITMLLLFLILVINVILAKDGKDGKFINNNPGV